MNFSYNLRLAIFCQEHADEAALRAAAYRARNAVLRPRLQRLVRANGCMLLLGSSYALLAQLECLPAKWLLTTVTWGVVIQVLVAAGVLLRGGPHQLRAYASAAREYGCLQLHFQHLAKGSYLNSDAQTQHYVFERACLRYQSRLRQDVLHDLREEELRPSMGAQSQRDRTK